MRFLLLDSDSFVVPTGVLHDIANRSAHDDYVYRGRCSSTNLSPIIFGIGGSGLLLNSKLVQKMLPIIPTCKEYEVFIDDARLGIAFFTSLHDKEQSPKA